MVDSTYDHGRTGFSPPKAESSFELSGSSEASLNPDSRSRGRVAITPLVKRSMGAFAPCSQEAMDVGIFAKVSAKRSRGRRQAEEESDEDDMEDIMNVVRRAISGRRASRLASTTSPKPLTSKKGQQRSNSIQVKSTYKEYNKGASPLGSKDPGRRRVSPGSTDPGHPSTSPGSKDPGRADPSDQGEIHYQMRSKCWFASISGTQGPGSESRPRGYW